MREALQVLYLKNDSSSLENLLRMISVKTEVADHDEEHEFKADVKNIVDNHAFDEEEDGRADNYSDDEDENEDWKPEKKSFKKTRFSG